jgi:hypothetical protein
MPKSARTIDPEPGPAVAEAVTKSAQARPRSAPGKRLPPRPKAMKPSPKSNDAKRDLSTGKSLRSHLNSQASALLFGAGIGAALTLSVVALRAKGRPPTTPLFDKKSTLASVLLKTAVYAVGRVSTRGSITNLLARAVANSLA